jgi:hypothetical protein
MEAPKYFVVRVKTKRENDNGKIRTYSEAFLVNAMTVTEAEARVVKKLSGSKDEYSISSAAESRIIEVIEG